MSNQSIAQHIWHAMLFTAREVSENMPFVRGLALRYVA